MAQFREEEHPRDNDGKFKEKGASPRDGMNWNEYSKIVQSEIIEFSKTTKEKYGIISTLRKG